ncbi:hypothetical protein PSECIP111951_04130 [Pseudoalteromonas holothuriae]|uniref:Uncharacterized protein n=1 Tax=Pseudoalteromonas holothuriae TaxID=2963714 RepID=A0ABM9GNM7_9GAMM|nr:hypothetical protein PSECIP111951_04130 [Pseudoalteromonas sp. CIP111951]
MGKMDQVVHTPPPPLKYPIDRPSSPMTCLHTSPLRYLLEHLVNANNALLGWHAGLTARSLMSALQKQPLYYWVFDGPAPQTIHEYIDPVDMGSLYHSIYGAKFADLLH